MAVACSSTGSAARGGRWRTPRGRPRSLLPGWEREVSLDGLSDVVAGCQAAVLRAGWVSWAGLAGFWCTGWQGRLRAQVPEPAPDPGGGEPSRPCGPLPGPAQIVGEGAGEPELGVAGDDEPGPAVGRLGSAELWCGPAQERARQGPLRQTPGDRRAGLRPSRSSRAPAGSCAAACAPARPSGSCCAAPTTCSSSGGTQPPRQRPGRPPPERPPGGITGAAASAVDQPSEPSPEAPERSGTISEMATRPFRNGLESYNTCRRHSALGGLPPISHL